MSAMEIDTLWHSAFGESSTRPVIYSSEELNEEGWQPLTDPQNFAMNLANLNHPQLYAASANNQLAMKLAQEEYLDLERHIADIKGRDTTKNPQSLPEPDVFEERKEAALYGYKYDASRPALLQAGIPGLRSADDLTESEKHDVRLFQDPFEQGGFVPKEREYKAMMAKAKDPKNIDGWKPIIDKAGRRLIPRQQTHHDEYNITYIKRNVDENGEIIRPVSPEGSEVPGETPDKAVNKRLTRTRFDGKKFPPTRDVSEAPSTASTPRGRKRASPSGADGRENTPSSKRQKVTLIVNGQEQPKPKHPNQYTKAREREAKERGLAAIGTAVAQASAKAASSSKGSWRDLSPASKRTHNWAGPADLVEAVKEDHTWLHDDPAKAEHWKNKLLENVNPIRSFAMYKKWNEWRRLGLDKRPRNKNVMAEDGAPNKGNGDFAQSQKPRRRAAKAKRAGGSARSTPATTPATTPAPEVVNVNGIIERAATPAVKPKGAKLFRGRGLGNENFRQRFLQEEKEKRNGKQAGTEPGTPSRVDEEASARENSEEVSENARSIRRPSLKHQGSESTIVVNRGTMPPNPTGTPPRRSLRNARRASG